MTISDFGTLPIEERVASTAPASEPTGMAGATVDCDSQLDAACDQACEAIAPAWPLDRAIAVNPHWSRIGLPLRQVAARMAVLGDIHVFPTRESQQQARKNKLVHARALSRQFRHRAGAVGKLFGRRVNGIEH